MRMCVHAQQHVVRQQAGHAVERGLQVFLMTPNVNEAQHLHASTIQTKPLVQDQCKRDARDAERSHIATIICIYSTLGLT